MTAPELLELHRTRWRRAREDLDLVDPTADGFGTGGLARHAPDAHVRFLVLPREPERTNLELDEDMWSWWMEDRPNPFEGAIPTRWGTYRMPHATGAVRTDRWDDDRWKWETYIAMLRSGGLEFGLGRVGSTSWRRSAEGDEVRVFFVTTIVGRIWVALSLYAELQQRFSIQGPWEVTVALRDSLNGVLGNVAAGWEEPERAFPREDLPRCPEPNVLVRREVASWEDDDAPRSLAFELGANIEDAFGFEGRRYLARIGPDLGRFDVSRYRS